MKYNIVTISREFGSGGRYIGEELAKNSVGLIMIKSLFQRWPRKPVLQRNLWLRPRIFSF